MASWDGKRMSGSNLRGKVIAPVVTTGSCSETVTFCSQTCPALGMLDTPGRNYIQAKAILCLRTFRWDCLWFRGDTLTSVTENWYFFLPLPLFELDLMKKECGRHSMVFLQNIRERNSWKDILKRTSIPCLEMRGTGPERLRVLPKSCHEWVADYQGMQSWRTVSAFKFCTFFFFF